MLKCGSASGHQEGDYHQVEIDREGYAEKPECSAKQSEDQQSRLTKPFGQYPGGNFEGGHRATADCSQHANLRVIQVEGLREYGQQYVL